MKKRLLLIMPNFFNYPQEICKELENMGYEVDFFDDRPSTNGFVKAIIRLKKELIGKYIELYFEKMMNIVRKKKYDIVFLISGQSLSFSKEMIIKIKEKQTNAKFILYQWDSLNNFQYIKEISPLFDECYSFDRDDAENNINLRFLPLFYTKQYELMKSKNQKERFDFCFIGTAHPKKYKFIKLMSNKLKKVYPNQFIYYFFPSRIVFFYRKIINTELRKSHYSEFHFKPLLGEEMNSIYSESKCVLDSAQAGQKGLTIRVIEALGASKKIITTNTDVLNYDFYCEENIYVYNGGEFDYKSPFFTKPYKQLEEKIYKKYSLKNWLKTMGI